MKALNNVFGILKETATEWMADKAPRLGAALSYYTVFSIAPLIIIAITIAGLVFADAQQQIIAQVRGMVGEQSAEAIQSMIKAAQKPAQSTVATLLGFATLIFGAAGVFIQLKDALNTIWNVKESSASGVFAFIKKYFLSFSMVLGIGFLLLISLLLEAGLAIASNFVIGHLPGLAVLMKILALVISFATVTLLFAMLFKFLPDVRIPWHDVWIGAVLTAALFVAGKIGLGVYLGKMAAASAYGAAGSLVIVLLWVYYSAQILFFGAEFTQVYSRKHGSRSTKPPEKKLESPSKENLVKDSNAQRRELSHTFHHIRTTVPRPRFLARFQNSRHLISTDSEKTGRSKKS
ncbi:MAG: YihY/virulence factor BrkB family protein [Verrucomicrobiota bacterium]